MVGPQAGCCIVSARSNESLDAYVLSESSLFVYPDKAVLKTCGTTKLLDAVPLLLELAAGLGLTCSRCKYSRASFLFPDSQVRLVSPRLPRTPLITCIGPLLQLGHSQAHARPRSQTANAGGAPAPARLFLQLPPLS